MLPSTHDSEPRETTSSPERAHDTLDVRDLDPDDSILADGFDETDNDAGDTDPDARRSTRPYWIELGFESTD